MINTIKDSIKTIIEAHCSGVQEVRDYNALEFTGFPAVSISFADNDNDFATNKENERIFAYKIRVFVSLSNAGQPLTEEKAQRAERIMGDVVWSIINALDNHETLDDNVEYCEASPSTWEYVSIQNGVCLMANISLKAHKYYELS